MRKKTVNWLLLLAVLACCISIFECENGDDDDSEDVDFDVDSDDSSAGDDDVDDDDDDDDDDYTDPDCLGNIYPELISVSAFINGEPVEFPFTAYESDEITFSFEYDDPDCNLIVDGDGGGISFREVGTYAGVYALGRLPDDSPCSTIEAGYPVDVVMDLINRLGYGEHQGWIYTRDKCGPSSELYLEFNLPFTGR